MKPRCCAWLKQMLLSFCIALTSCQSRHGDTGPSIEFSKIPPAAQGGRERVDTIAGRVKNPRPGQQIVIYARSGPWWVQPWPDRPFIPIRADSTWSTETHLGFEYAAMLVDPGYHPTPTMDVAPTQGGSVVAVAIVKGVGETQFAPTKPLHFSGYDWKVRTITSDRGGLNNLYDGDNAWTDAGGALHLRITKKAGKWSCAQDGSHTKSRVRNLHRGGEGHFSFGARRGSKYEYVRRLGRRPALPRIGR